MSTRSSVEFDCYCWFFVYCRIAAESKTTGSAFGGFPMSTPLFSFGTKPIAKPEDAESEETKTKGTAFSAPSTNTDKPVPSTPL